MPAHASPHTPPEVPNLFGKGALEKKGETIFSLLRHKTQMEGPWKPHLQALCDSFLSVGWHKVTHYKEAFNLGLAVGYRWKNSFDWPLGGSLGDWFELSQILASRECNSL